MTLAFSSNKLSKYVCRRVIIQTFTNRSRTIKNWFAVFLENAKDDFSFSGIRGSNQHCDLRNLRRKIGHGSTQIL